MKTVKLIFAALLLAITVYSCSSDRDEEKVNPTSNQKVDVKKLKLTNNQKETGKVGDSILPAPQKANDLTQGVNQTDPNAPSPVVDPTKPDKPW